MNNGKNPSNRPITDSPPMFTRAFWSIEIFFRPRQDLRKNENNLLHSKGQTARSKLFFFFFDRHGTFSHPGGRLPPRRVHARASQEGARRIGLARARVRRRPSRRSAGVDASNSRFRSRKAASRRPRTIRRTHPVPTHCAAAGVARARIRRAQRAKSFGRIGGRIGGVRPPWGGRMCTAQMPSTSRTSPR